MSETPLRGLGVAENGGESRPALPAERFWPPKLGPDQAEGPLGDGEDLRRQVLAEVGTVSQVYVQLIHQLFDVAQLGHHQTAPSSIAVHHALHLSML